MKKPNRNTIKKGTANKTAHHKPDDFTRQLVEKMSGRGFVTEDIADMLDISRTTLYRHYKKEVKRGRVVAVYHIAEKLYQIAMKGNVTALIFFLKTQGGWKES